MTVDSFDIELLGGDMGHKILWKGSQTPRGEWFYDDANSTFHIRISGNPDGQEKEHVFVKIAKTQTWSLLTDVGSHNHRHGNSVMLIKNVENE